MPVENSEVLMKLDYICRYSIKIMGLPGGFVRVANATFVAALYPNSTNPMQALPLGAAKNTTFTAVDLDFQLTKDPAGVVIDGRLQVFAIASSADFKNPPILWVRFNYLAQWQSSRTHIVQLICSLPV